MASLEQAQLSYRHNIVKTLLLLQELQKYFPSKPGLPKTG
jgi:hypothetical protein